MWELGKGMYLPGVCVCSVLSHLARLHTYDDTRDARRPGGMRACVTSLLDHLCSAHSCPEDRDLKLNCSCAQAPEPGSSASS
jgi:hypothetical protein